MGHGKHNQVVSDLEKELELDGMEAPDELQIKTVTQQTTQQNPEKSKPICHHCRKPGHYLNQCRQPKQEKDQAQNNKNNAGKNENNNKVVRQTLTSVLRFPTIQRNQYKQSKRPKTETHLPTL